MSPAMHHYLKRSNSSFFDMQHALPYLVRHTLTYTQCFACDAGDVTYNALARVTNQITYQLVSDIRLHSINAATPAAPSNYQTTRCHHVAHASSCQTTRQHQSTFKLPNHTMSSRCCTYFTVTSPLATSSKHGNILYIYIPPYTPLYSKWQILFLKNLTRGSQPHLTRSSPKGSTTLWSIPF